jgi:glycosyltransferase involved in cell wall biosynthesis
MHEALEPARRDGDEPPPDPYGPEGLLGWLEDGGPRSGGSIGRYWFEEWVRRPDLHIAFPDPIGDDKARFEAWAEASWRSDGRSAVIRPTPDNTGSELADVGRLPGVNVIGYVASDSGLGDFTRRLYQSLVGASVPVGAIHYHRTASPTAEGVPPLTTDLEYDTNLITVHSDHMGFFADDHGATVFPGRTNIGYWFWELSELSPRSIAAAGLVDEVWAATTFVGDAYRRVTDKPVRVVPIPVPRPHASAASRAELGLPEDRFVFLVTLDHLSITDRKNPMGAVRAFQRAFPTVARGGPVLVVKTLNGSQRWAEHEELQVAATARPDIVVIDRHVSRSDQMRLIELADCLVSLHRSEGLGLHLMEAMWLGTPVIGTRYSGNLDFMNDDNSVLIDADLIPVSDRQGYYPTGAVWADPDLDAAAAAMRQVVDDEPLLDRLVTAARRDMMNQPSMAQTGHLIARLCREAEPTSKE